jgi:hypothetical protein
MEDVEIKTPEPQDTADLQEQLDALRHLIGSVLILVVVVSGTLCIYLWRQVHDAGKDLDILRPYASNLVASYQKGDGPSIETFLRNIAEYGRTHPEFIPVLNKYGIRPASAPPTASAAPPAQQPKKQ